MKPKLIEGGVAMRRERWTVALTVTGLLGGGAPLLAEIGDCASTPAAALKAASRASVDGAVQNARPPLSVGYRVESVRWDAMQRQSWAVIRSCDHAERPALAMLTDLPQGGVQRMASGPVVLALEPKVNEKVVSQTASARIVAANAEIAAVHAGEVVRLWKADEQAHIELTGLAEENGALGRRVRVRLATAKGLNGQDLDGQSGLGRVLMGVVRGPADVEIER